MNAFRMLGLLDGAKLEEIRQAYLDLAKKHHPDAGGDTAKFQEIQLAYDFLTKRDTKPVKVGKWEVTSFLSQGDLANIYRVSPLAHNAYLKVARSSNDNDLLEAEAVALKAVHFRYTPQVADSFKVDGCAANVLVNPRPNESWTFGEIIDLYPALDYRHVIWMGNRLFSALMQAHSKGFVHGAINPDHLIYGGITHGLTLIDWCYSVKIGEKVPAFSVNRKSFVAPEILEKKPVTPAADIFSAAKTLSQVAPLKRFKNFFEWCLSENPNSRPQDAVQVYETWTKLAELEFGPRQYIPLDLKEK